MTADQDKVAIITGGASGIGRAVGEVLGGSGVRLVLTDINEALLEEATADMLNKGMAAEGIPLDVTKVDQVAKVVRDTNAKYGRIDYMFNNAGVNVCGEMVNTSLEDWDFLIDVNIKGVVYGVHEVLPIMLAQGFGHIVNTASVAGLIPAIGEGAYGATKHAVVGMSLTLRAEVEADGVQVSVVCPGVVRTPLVHTTRFKNVNGEKLMEELPLRMMDVNAAARVIVRGVEKNKAIICFPGHAQSMWRMHRLSPDALQRIAGMVLKRLRRAV